jgi:uncharacterized protein YgiM (DUF1202 family)
MRAVVLSICLGLLTVAAYPFTQAQVAKNNVNVRIDSTPMSPILGVLNVGEQVTVIEEKFDWARIVLPQRFSCFVAAEFLKELESDKAEVVGDNINLRNEPSRMAFVVGKVSKGKTLFIQERLKGWYKVIAYPYASGWVHINFLEKVKAPAKNEGVVNR